MNGSPQTSKTGSLSCAVMALALLALVGWAQPTQAQSTGPLPAFAIEQFGHPPAIPEGALSSTLRTAVRMALTEGAAKGIWGRDQLLALEEIAESKDPRVAWIISDMMRFTWQRDVHERLGATAAVLLGAELKTNKLWGEVTDHLIA